MSKNYKRDKELDILDRLKGENKRLKRENKSLRRMLDKYNVLEELGRIKDDVILPSKKRMEEKKQAELWGCYKCTNGVLRLRILYGRYRRVCDKCGKETKWQEYTKDVKGV